MINKIIIPQLGVNDDEALLESWYVSSKTVVEKGDLLVSIETSKAIQDIESEYSGTIVLLVEEGNKAKINDPIAIVGDDLEELLAFQMDYIIRMEKTNIHATEKAKIRAKEWGINLELMNISGIIKEKDVIAFVDAAKTSTSISSIEQIPEDSVAIYGAGNGAITVSEVLALNGIKTACYIDDNPSKAEINKIQVHKSDRLDELITMGLKNIFVAISDGHIRSQKYASLLLASSDLEFINVIHPRAHLAESVKIGYGNYIKSGAVIETESVLGNGCLIDNNVTIAHHNEIHDYCHLAPGVTLGSSIVVGEMTIIGIGASVSTKIKIGENSIISVGSSVTSDVPRNSVVEGVPGKIIGQRKSNNAK